MGEAKRRKKLDPEFGNPHKRVDSRVRIVKSELTPNWLIYIDNHCYDSALDYSDAVYVADAIKRVLIERPLPLNCKESQFQQWVMQLSNSD